VKIPADRTVECRFWASSRMAVCCDVSVDDDNDNDDGSISL
jgi:hypothetical protein